MDDESNFIESECNGFNDCIPHTYSPSIQKHLKKCKNFKEEMQQMNNL